MQAISPLITLSPSSPSFNSYSSDKLAEIAARVVLEFTSESEQPEGSSNDIFSWRVQEEEENNRPKNDNEEEEEEEEEFEFAVLSMPEPQFPPMSADDIFYNGQIRPFYPLFNTKLLLDDQESLPKSKTATDSTQDNKKPNRFPLKKLFYEDRETFSCSSSEADDVDSAEPGTYCVWTAKKEEGSLGSCKKSSSTGSNSKRWKFKDLLHRSNSDGKDTFVFLTPNNKKSGSHKRFGSDDHESKNNKNKESTEKKERSERSRRSISTSTTILREG
ncbi:hypothetical protein OIU77_007697 [Salix suchowensis]|uniref:Uncharacterized protein n=1 Tax=Salix suchowensis TaxID=1278906 RepID=A0ABQ9AH61_9ROSI|nr:hypothetical protein OIU77_007697 [Salix suchowensis]